MFGLLIEKCCGHRLRLSRLTKPHCCNEIKWKCFQSGFMLFCSHLTVDPADANLPIDFLFRLELIGRLESTGSTKPSSGYKITGSSENIAANNLNNPSLWPQHFSKPIQTPPTAHDLTDINYGLSLLFILRHTLHSLIETDQRPRNTFEACYLSNKMFLLN